MRAGCERHRGGGRGAEHVRVQRLAGGEAFAGRGTGGQLSGPAEQMRVDLRFVTSVESPGGSGYAAGSWVVQDGQPGAEPA